MQDVALVATNVVFFAFKGDFEALDSLDFSARSRTGRASGPLLSSAGKLMIVVTCDMAVVEALAIGSPDPQATVEKKRLSV